LGVALLLDRAQLVLLVLLMLRQVCVVGMKMLWILLKGHLFPLWFYFLLATL
jgi:hypothetical protein